jgi:hypothetical protein
MYLPVVVAPNTPAVVRQVLAQTCDLYLHDVHAMLRLPFPSTGITVACNFSAAAVLMNIVSGISATLYEPGNQARQAGSKFRGVLRDFYPWDLEPADQATVSEAAAKVIYKIFRNPMAHALGFQEPGGGKAQIFIRRMPKGGEFGLGDYVLGLIERSLERPNDELWNVPTLHHDPPRTSLFVEPFYWGVREMIRRLTHDTVRMEKAEAFLQPFMK